MSSWYSSELNDYNLMSNMDQVPVIRMAESDSSLNQTTNNQGDSSQNDAEASSSSSNEDNGGRGRKGQKKQQFTIKQRMDMYAFCVLEMEVNGNKVSIKKQQQAVKKMLEFKLERFRQQQQLQREALANTKIDSLVHIGSSSQVTEQQQQSQVNSEALNKQSHNEPENIASNTLSTTSDKSPGQSHSEGPSNQNGAPNPQSNQSDGADSSMKTLSEMRSGLNARTYSDYQKIMPLTTQMLRNVQERYSKYYPDSPPPSRTTIKHVFEKCVKNGSVENIKNKRKAVKIPKGDEITELLMKEPQLSLRQLARRLNVSTGTISRRCKTLGLVPDSVTTKHQQMALAKRQKQMKMMENEQKQKGGNSNGNVIPTSSSMQPKLSEPAVTRASSSRGKQLHRLYS